MELIAGGEAVDVKTGGGVMDVRSGGGAGALREDLLDLLRQGEVRRKMNEALLREATGEAKSTGVIRAYELVQKILQEAGEDVPVEELNLRQFSDSQLRAMIERIRREENSSAHGGDGSVNSGEDRNEDNRNGDRNGDGNGDGNGEGSVSRGGGGHGQPETH